MKVFARRGFAATRVEDVLEEAGVARRTFYRYFTSKEDVLVAVYELATSELLRALDRLSEGPELAEPFSGIDLYIDFHVENGPLLRVLTTFAAAPDSSFASSRRNFRARILRIMVRAAEARRVAPLDGFMYVALVSALEGVAQELIEGAASTAEITRAKKAIHALVTKALTV